MTNSSLDRRTFLGASLAARAVAEPLGANDRIGVGLVGCGLRMNALLKDFLQFSGEANVEVRAVCDVWRPRREKAAAAMKQAFGREPRQIVHFQDLLAMPDVDALIIASPDHHHCRMLSAAVRAGKDVYVEKPLAMEMKELIQAVDAVKASRRVVQVGTQIRSYPHSAAARDFVKAGGLGKIIKVEQARNAHKPYWQSRGKLPVNEADVDWKAFLGHRKFRPWDPIQFTGWYGYHEFSRGAHAGLMVHFIDLVHFVTGAQFPSRGTALGGIYRWKDGYDAPDSIEVLLEYPEGFLVSYSTVFGTGAGNYFTFFGTRGTIDAQRWSWTEPWGLSGEGSEEPDRLAPGAKLPEVASTPHMKNWLECLRTRKEPNAPIETGYSHSVAAIMADESYMRGRRMVYDHAKRAIREG